VTRVLVPSRTGFNATIVAGLEANGIECITLPPVDPATLGPRPSPTQVQSRFPTPEEIAEIWPTLDGFLGGTVTRECLEAGVNLRVGASWVIGTENIDVQAATDLGIVIAYGAVPENYLGVAEAVVMLSAALIKRLPAKLQVTREMGERLVDTGHMVGNSTIGLIGLGNIGKAVARRLQGWGARLIGCDPYIDPKSVEGLNVELVDLDTLLKSADIVSLSVLLTDETRNMINEHTLSLMKPGSYFINTSRGRCVEEQALLQALDSGHLAGAALDVWEHEPPGPENPLRMHPKVMATSHNVGHSTELFEQLPPAAIENLVRGLRGEEPRYVRNPEVLPAWRNRLERLGLKSKIVVS
jgi:D-3-phosphoglycerate dehydrogenase / 2-oxoglutarate reductase